MSVIVDTSIWSLALRRNTPNSEIVDRLRTLIAEDEISILGAIRQEILSGIRTAEQFTRLRDYLRAFPDLTLVQDDYEIAAEFFNTCRRNGIQGSNTDFLICAAAYRRNDSIFTTDQDFRSFQTYLPIQLLE
ncbi:putative PilT protein [Leptolyngbya boryana NIES-2135]|jgi:predicted nucleic acid-binding protein|uniref:Putative PilT protein n=1 Tax=Leptolyngbya boryana NIES-2135 TaxID=1973484 RepID=A0A1Z4JN09_LEPBY|nr:MULTISPECIES: PIN domain-containing protein [Leptolyngbya]BAY58144.1 putative PilT protein [Leptolyngbya boryana NIES-2135]MBD2369129.1 PIN domain-containing protein [Leptolyngbya sp. FACHB-161]MBD2375524.1 PIN domain-containing protein [Leptolyngbya sp. FACHB-238]MBD2400098.1 PIN domain-containing protein [Leptolyngbya sp. FACHB-239]MBD2406458.1 PIN domain-containing protein [Leptolyngbya sp. FACHB-402]